MSGLDDTSYTTVTVTATPYTVTGADYMVLVKASNASGAMHFLSDGTNWQIICVQ